MDTDDKKIIIKRYQERLSQHGQSVKALSSGNNERQFLRFANLCQVGDLEGKKILDFGCGMGDFLHFLKHELKINVNYTGVDIVPEFIQIAKERFPDQQFTTEDVLKTDFFKTNKFDYIFCSQVFNNKYLNTDPIVFVQEVMGILYSASNEAVVMDFVTDYVDFKEDHLNYYSPENIFSLAKKLTKRVTLKNDYPLFEFMIFAYKDFRGWGTSKK